MDFRGWGPPEIAIGGGLIVLLGGSWIVYGLYQFDGDTILDALRSAREAMATSEHNSLYGRTE